MQNVTGQDVKDAVEISGINRVDHHECSMCGYMTHYEIHGGTLFFNPGCDCSWSGREPRAWDSAANWINMQSNNDVRAELMRKFGFPDER